MGGNQTGSGSNGTGLGDQIGSGSYGTGLGDQIGSGSHGTGLGDQVVSGSNGMGLGNQKIAVIGAGKLSVVIPYLKEKAQGNELLYAIRSLERNFREDFQIVVIGDKEDWFGDKIIHIDAPVVSVNPQIDTLNKLKLAIVDERVSDDFIWSNDDIYFISPVQLADIQILKAAGKLDYLPKSQNVYDQNRNKTIDFLRIIQKLSPEISLHNYDTHTPFYFNKEKLVDFFERIVPMQHCEGVLVSSLYYNLVFAGYKPMQIDGVHGEFLLRINSKNTDPVTFERFVADKKFLNNSENGFNDLLNKFLATNFYEKSSFEA